MSRVKGNVVKVVENGRQAVTTYATGGLCPHCGLTHSIEASRENHARVGLQESYDFCASLTQSQQAVA